jgi:anti-anti-sigma factor
MKLTLRGHEGGLLLAACEGSMTLLPPTGPGDALKQVLGSDVFQQTVLLDLGGVDYIDSSGVSWLLVAHSRFAEQGGRLILHSAPPRVRETFALLRLETVLALADDEAAARARAGGAAP